MCPVGADWWMRFADAVLWRVLSPHQGSGRVSLEERTADGPQAGVAVRMALGSANRYEIYAAAVPKTEFLDGAELTVLWLLLLAVPLALAVCDSLSH